MTDETDAELVEGVRRGSRDAAGHLIERYLVSLSEAWQPGESPPTGGEFLRALTDGGAP